MARRLAELNGLTPPVDVLKLARSLADTKQLQFPDWASADGLTLNLKVPNQRPLIVVNQRINEFRQRFTLAHEIGHVIIPWHIGDIVDDLNAANNSTNSRYRRLEAEANRFAAELLMPSDWTERICNEVEHLRGAVITVAEVAQVSLAASALRVLQKGPAGYVVAYTTDSNIELIGQTEGTKAALPEKGTSVDNLRMTAFEPPEIYPKGKNAIFVWKELDSVAPPGCPPDDWRSLLASILNSFPAERRKTLQNQLNAIVGYRLSKHPKGTDVEVLYKDVVKAFENRTDHNQDVQIARKHRDFDSYVVARIYERADS